MKIVLLISSEMLCVFYGYETWFFCLREQHRLRVFENKVVRKVLGPMADEGTILEPVT
jgi:hypothetical protein